MSTLALFMGLLFLAYAGSFLVGRGRLLALPSGAEYVLLGFALGAHGLGVLDDSLVAAFDPVAGVALGWLSLLVGLSFGIAGGRRVGAVRLLAGALAALVTGGTIALVVWEVMGAAAQLDGTDRALIAGGVGAACGESSRRAIRVLLDRSRASGPLASFYAEVATADDLVPLLATAVLFALKPRWPVPWLPVRGTPGEPLAWGAATVGLGVVLGAASAILLAGELRRTQTWSVLVGASLLGMGLASRLGLSPISALFAMGVTLGAASRQAGALRELLAPSERPVLHPALLLAGAHVDPFAASLPLLVACALCARVAGKALFGAGALAVSSAARRGGLLAGAGLLPCGALAMTVGFAFALRFPGPVGTAVLSTAAAATALGELLGPWALRGALRRAGEIAEDDREVALP